MKSFRQFMEQPEIVNMMRGFAQQNKKSPKELRVMRDKIVSGVGNKLAGKMDFGKILNKIPDAQELSTKFKKAETGLKNKISDPSTQQKFDNVFRMIDSLAGKKK